MPPVPKRAVAALVVAATALPILSPAGAQPASPPVSLQSVSPPPADPGAPMADLPDFGVAWPTLTPAPAPVAGQTAGGEAGELRRYRVSVEGIEGLGSGFRTRFDQLSALVAQEGKPANAAQVDRRAREDETVMAALLRAAGHYDGTVTSSVGAEANGLLVRLKVEPGPLYSFSAVGIPGVETAGARAPHLASELPLKAGDPVDAGKVEAAVASFRTTLGREGYPFARVADPQVEVDHAAHTARLSLPVTLGSPARFGRIIATGQRPVFSVSHLAVIARFRPGDPYDAGLLEDFRRALIATSLVSVAQVTPSPGGDPGTVNVTVHTERAPPRTIAGEFGYGTGEGARAEVSWQHRNLLPPEGGVTFRGVLGTREQSLGAVLRRGNFHARDRVFTAQVAANHSNFDAYDARTFTVGAGIERQTNIIWQKRWVWSAGTEFLASDERDTIQATGQGRRRTFLVGALPGSLAYDTSDDLLNPTRGIRLTGRLSPEVNLRQGADAYLRLQVDASGYLPVTGATVIAGRVRVASIPGTPRDAIAPSRRLYAGGGGSVRGYGYQKIGPRDVDGDPVGGRGLFEAAVEARVRFGNFGVVPFFDMGQLSQSPRPKFDDLRFGTGIGARYYTSFGPIRVDLGTPIARRRGESRIAIYVSLGQAF